MSYYEKYITKSNEKEVELQGVYYTIHLRIESTIISLEQSMQIYGEGCRTKIKPVESVLRRISDEIYNENKGKREPSKSELQQLLEHLCRELDKIWDSKDDTYRISIFIERVLNCIQREIDCMSYSVYDDEEDDPIEALMKTGVTVMDFSKPSLTLY